MLGSKTRADYNTFVIKGSHWRGKDFGYRERMGGCSLSRWQAVDSGAQVRVGFNFCLLN